MKISRTWLQTFFETQLPSTAELCDALTFHVFEIDGVDTVHGDDVLDVKVTANRGHDCLCHRGIALELSAILQLPLKSDPLRHLPMLVPSTDTIAVSVNTPLANRYIAGYIKGVKVGPSPEWLRSCLESMGQRSVNNIVDATNYVMFNLGQPLHAFDAAKLQSATTSPNYSIGVRPAKSGEIMTALDGKEYKLDESVLVIVDAHADAPIGIAGVKGGAASGIDATTTDIIIESANFDSVSIRKTAQRLKLRTDASSRYEQAISSELAAYGMRAAVDLILKIADGELVGFVDVYPTKSMTKEVSVTVEQINNSLGVSLTENDVADAFKRLTFLFTQTGTAFTVTSPFERLDIEIPEDLIEEVGRIIGYDKVVPVSLPPLSHEIAINESFYWGERIREFLLEQGFSEVITSVFSDKGERVIANKVDGVRPYLREYLALGLSEALERNIRNKDILELSQVKIFEIGKVWREGKEFWSVAIAVEKLKKQETVADACTALVASLGASVTFVSNESECREIALTDLIAGLALPDTCKHFEPSATVRYQSFSKYPFVVRDIALWVPAGTEAEKVLEILRTQAGDLVVRSRLFDTFEKDGKLSLAFRLIFQSFERTLTDEEVNARMALVTTEVEKQGWQVR